LLGGVRPSRRGARAGASTRRERPAVRTETLIPPPRGTGSSSQRRAGPMLGPSRAGAAQGQLERLAVGLQRRSRSGVVRSCRTGRARQRVSRARCSTVAGPWTAPRGANVDVYRSENQPDQKWTLVARAGGGAFELHNLMRGFLSRRPGQGGRAGATTSCCGTATPTPISTGDGSRTRYARPVVEPRRPGPPPYPMAPPQRPTMPQELPAPQPYAAAAAGGITSRAVVLGPWRTSPFRAPRGRRSERAIPGGPAHRHPAGRRRGKLLHRRPGQEPHQPARLLGDEAQGARGGRSRASSIPRTPSRFYDAFTFQRRQGAGQADPPARPATERSTKPRAESVRRKRQTKRRPAKRRRRSTRRCLRRV